jgi:hypothetical protein
VGLRWVRAGVFLRLEDDAGRCRGEVVRSVLRRRSWLGWADPRMLDFFPTRAAAMRAVASACDAKKGYGL